MLFSGRCSYCLWKNCFQEGSIKDEMVVLQHHFIATAVSFWIKSLQIKKRCFSAEQNVHFLQGVPHAFWWPRSGPHASQPRQFYASCVLRKRTTTIWKVNILVKKRQTNKQTRTNLVQRRERLESDLSIFFWTAIVCGFIGSMGQMTLCDTIDLTKAAIKFCPPRDDIPRRSPFLMTSHPLEQRRSRANGFLGMEIWEKIQLCIWSSACAQLRPKASGFQNTTPRGQIFSGSRNAKRLKLLPQDPWTHNFTVLIARWLGGDYLSGILFSSSVIVSLKWSHRIHHLKEKCLKKWMRNRRHCPNFLLGKSGSNFSTGTEKSWFFSWIKELEAALKEWMLVGLYPSIILQNPCRFFWNISADVVCLLHRRVRKAQPHQHLRLPNSPTVPKIPEKDPPTKDTRPKDDAAYKTELKQTPGNWTVRKQLTVFRQVTSKIILFCSFQTQVEDCRKRSARNYPREAFTGEFLWSFHSIIGLSARFANSEIRHLGLALYAWLSIVFQISVLRSLNLPQHRKHIDLRKTYSAPFQFPFHSAFTQVWN